MSPRDNTQLSVLTLAEGYQVQRDRVDRLRAEGYRQVGWKLGFTSPRALDALGLSEPLVGAMMDHEVLRDGVTLQRADFATPRIEAEVALVLGCDISASDTVTNPMAVLASAHAAIEVVDAAQSTARLTPGQIVAGNVGFARAVIGQEITGDLTTLVDLSAEVIVDGRSRGVGRAVDTYGGPLTGFSWLTRFLSARGAAFRAGDIVLTGAFLPAIDMEYGHCDVVIGGKWRAAVAMT
jgi:2-keto-4-pentenoate hydratase